MKFINKQEKFSIRKYKSLGAASAVIGALVFHSGIVSAHESDVPVVEKNNSASNAMQSESKVSVEPKEVTIIPICDIINTKT